MIEISTLCNKFETSLNNYASSKKFDRDFIIYSSVGDREPNNRVYGGNTVTKRMYGVFSTSPSTLTAISGLTIVQVSATVSFICDLHTLVNGEEKTEGGEYAEVEALRKLLDGYVQENNGKVSNGVLAYYSLSSIGEAEIGSSESGEFVPVALNISYIYAENCYFGEDIKLHIDGKRIWYTSLNLNRNVTVETALFDGTDRLGGVGIERTHGIDFAVPLTKDNAGILDSKEDLNKWHWVSVQRGTAESEAFMMIFNSRIRSSEPTVIATVSASMTEPILKLTSPASNIILSKTAGIKSKADKTASYTIDTDLTSSTGKGNWLLIHWGDGTCSEAFKGGSRTLSHTYPRAETQYTAKIYRLA